MSKHKPQAKAKQKEETAEEKVKLSPIPPILRAQAPRLNLEQTFNQLTEYTTPHGFEPMLWQFIPHPSKGEGTYTTDGDKNVIVEVFEKDGTKSRVMFSSHLDTASYLFSRIKKFKGNNGAIYTDRNTILGADCKIGAAFMIQMIWNKISGQYVFHAGEEKGRIGSSARARGYTDVDHDYCIAFDRKGYGSIITHQMRQRTCSEDFAIALAAELHEPGILEFKSDDGGSYTDSYSYKDKIPECTNLSVGYFNQHSNNEVQDIMWAEFMCEKLMKVRWSTLPIVRTPDPPKVHTYSGQSWANRNVGYGYEDDDDDAYANWLEKNKIMVSQPRLEATSTKEDTKSGDKKPVSEKISVEKKEAKTTHESRCAHCRHPFPNRSIFLPDLGWVCGNCYEILKHMSVSTGGKKEEPHYLTYEEYCKFHYNPADPKYLTEDEWKRKYDPDFLHEEEWKDRFSTGIASGLGGATTNKSRKRKRGRNRRRRNKIGG